MMPEPRDLETWNRDSQLAANVIAQPDMDRNAIMFGIKGVTPLLGLHPDSAALMISLLQAALDQYRALAKARVG